MKAKDLIAALRKLDEDTDIVLGDGRILYTKPCEVEGFRIYVLHIEDSNLEAELKD